MIYRFQSTIMFLLCLAIALTLLSEEPSNLLLRFAMWFAIELIGFGVAVGLDTRRRWK